MKCRTESFRQSTWDSAKKGSLSFIQVSALSKALTQIIVKCFSFQAETVLVASSFILTIQQIRKLCYQFSFRITDKRFLPIIFFTTMINWVIEGRILLPFSEVLSSLVHSLARRDSQHPSPHVYIEGESNLSFMIRSLTKNFSFYFELANGEMEELLLVEIMTLIMLFIVWRWNEARQKNLNNSLLFNFIII